MVVLYRPQENITQNSVLKKFYEKIPDKLALKQRTTSRYLYLEILMQKIETTKKQRKNYKRRETIKKISRKRKLVYSEC